MIALAVAGAHAAVLTWLARPPRAPMGSAPAAVLPVWVDAPNPTPAPPAPEAQRPTRAARALRPTPPPAADGRDGPTQPNAASGPTAALPPPSEEPPAVAEAAAATDPPEVVAAAASPAAAPVAAPPAWPWPRAAELLYDVEGQARGIGYHARATLQWHADGRHYDLALTLRALWLQRSQHSHGELGPGGLRPRQFADRARRERTLSFAWGPDGAGQALREDGASVADVPSGTQDRLSLFVQLGALLLRDGAVPGQRWTLPVAGWGGPALWTFEVGGTETLMLGGTPTSAVRVQRLGPGDEVQITLWYQPTWAPLPVRVLLQETDSQRVDQTLREARLESDP